MELKFTVHSTDQMSVKEKEDFLVLLKEQGQVEKPSMQKVNACRWLCIVYRDGTAVGIGAIKRVGKTAFAKAGKPDLAIKFEEELGYLYVRNEAANAGLGLGKTISKLLLKQVADKNVFASTALGKDASHMLGILDDLGFKQAGDAYEGGKTKKKIGLFLKVAPSSKTEGR